ncbi:MAG: chloride channel protein [Anaerolineae bacterium]
MRRLFHRALNRLRVLMRRSDQGALITVAILLGLSVGAGVKLFQLGIELFHLAFQTTLTDQVLLPVFGALAIVISLSLAGALVGFVVLRFIGHESLHGVAAIMNAVAYKGGELPYRKMPAKALASAISLGAGASVGPEDPSVQIGANLGSWFGAFLRLHGDIVRLLVAAGVAAAIAAAFKAPIAGVFFALEIILNGAFEVRSFSVIVLAAVVSSALTQALSPEAEMGPFNYSLGSPLEIAVFLPLGLVLGLVSVAFIRLMYWQRDRWDSLHRLPLPAKTALAGALVGVVAIFLPQIMGPGRETMNAVLSGEAGYSIGLLIVLGVAKLVMTTVSLGGGFVGGVFAPAMFVGTMLGAAYGQLVVSILPGDSGNAQGYAIAGMAAMLGGAIRSPITAILLVFELTNDYKLILPIMLATVGCVIVAEHLSPGIYHLGLSRHGIRLPGGKEVDLLQRVKVREAMRSPAPAIAESASLVELRDGLRNEHAYAMVVLDEDNGLAGVVTLVDLQSAYSATGGAGQTVADICTRKVITIGPEDTVRAAVRRMGDADVGRLPVVEPESGAVVGLFDRKGVMRAYKRASGPRRASQPAP